MTVISLEVTVFYCGCANQSIIHFFGWDGGIKGRQLRVRDVLNGNLFKRKGDRYYTVCTI